MSESEVIVEPRTNLILVSIGINSFQELWLTRNEALALLDALPAAINKLPTHEMERRTR